MGSAEGSRKAAETRARNKAAVAAGEQPSLPETTEQGPAPRVVGEDDVKRVALPVNMQGRIALELLSEKAKQRLVAMFNDPAVQALGVKAQSASTSTDEIDPMVTGVLYDAIGSLAASIAVATGHTVDSARLMAFTAEEKAALAEPTARVLNKYSGSWSKWQDEIALGLLLVTFGQAKLSLLVKRPAEVRKFPAAAPDLAAPNAEPQS